MIGPESPCERAADCGRYNRTGQSGPVIWLEKEASMFRIGILGSDNSHALVFSKLCNIPDAQTGIFAFPDMRITAIHGHDDDPAHTSQVAREGRIERIVDRPEEMMGTVDAVMVVHRHGALHAPMALPFLRAGIPVWIDKPLTLDPADVEMLTDEAVRCGALLTGGSTCRYAPEVLSLKEAREDGKIGAVRSAYLNFPGDAESRYGGLFFYGPHTAEMVLAIFGESPRTVRCMKAGAELAGIVSYDGFSVMLDFTKSLGVYSCVMHGEMKTLYREIDISTVYRQGFERFAAMLRTGKAPLTAGQLAMPIRMLAALERSRLAGGTEVLISPEPV